MSHQSTWSVISQCYARTTKSPTFSWGADFSWEWLRKQRSLLRLCCCRFPRMGTWLRNTRSCIKRSWGAILSFDVENLICQSHINHIITYKRNEHRSPRTQYQAKYTPHHIDLQEFLLYLLDDVERYFKAAPPMSEDKAIASVNTIFGKLQKDFPLVAAVTNLAKKLVTDIRDKIADVSTLRCREHIRRWKKRRIRASNHFSNRFQTKVPTSTESVAKKL